MKHFSYMLEISIKRNCCYIQYICPKKHAGLRAARLFSKINSNSEVLKGTAYSERHKLSSRNWTGQGQCCGTATPTLAALHCSILLVPSFWVKPTLKSPHRRGSVGRACIMLDLFTSHLKRFLKKY